MALRSTDVFDLVKDLVGSSGNVKMRYGGLEIEILHSDEFPWNNVVKAIMDVGQDIWLSRKGGHVFVLSKPPAI